MSIYNIEVFRKLFAVSLLLNLPELAFGLLHCRLESSRFRLNFSRRDASLNHRHPITINQMTSRDSYPGCCSDADENSILGYVNLHRSRH